ncbi:TPA: aminopeptidase, partial [Escherichia coli]
PAVMITDTAFYRNKQYHLPGDTADRLNYQKMAQVVDGVITLLYNSK